MATLIQPKSAKEIGHLGVGNVRQAYHELAKDYERIINNDVLLCPMCNTWQKAETSFYFDKKYATNRYPLCKRCIMRLVEQRESDKDEPNETKESVQRVLQMMDRVYDDAFYEDCVKGALDAAKEKNRMSPFATYFTSVQSLPQFKGKTWKDSIFGDVDPEATEEDIKENSRLIKAARKRFGTEYSLADLQYLEMQYEDWVSRYECNTKAQEEIFERLACKKWEISKATKNGLPTKDLDKTYQELLSTANITPRQTGMDAFADTQTLGTLLQKWEETRPSPEIDPELEDVDRIGVYIDAFFKGHTAKMLGIKNTFSNIYEKVMSKYKVKPPEYEDEEDSEALFGKIFGNTEDY